jgi:hypothetical protein
LRLEHWDRARKQVRAFPSVKEQSQVPFHSARQSQFVASDRSRVKALGGPECLPAKRLEISKMPLLQILMVLVVVGVLLWLVNSFIPMQGQIKSILNGVVVIAVVLWLLNIFGLFHSLSRIRIGA